MSRPQVNPQISRAPFLPVAGKPRLQWPGFVALFVLAFLIYWPALPGGMLWDDDAHLTKPELRSLAGLGRIWTEVGATQQYYPVLHSAFWLEHRLWGDSTLGYHVSNVLLHAANACLLVLVTRRLLRVTGDSTPDRQSPVTDHRSPVTSISWIAGFVFVIHPVAVESVAWMTEQKNTLSTFFYLLAGLAYLRFAEGCSPAREGRDLSGESVPSLPGRATTRHETARRAGRLWYAVASCLFVLALLTKSVTATLPCALLVLAWWRSGWGGVRRDLVPLAPWIAAGVAMGLFTAWVERTHIGASGEAYALGGVERVILAGRIAWFYAAKLAWPAELAFVYPRWEIDAAVAGQWIYPLGAAALVVALAARRRRGALAAVLVFGGTLFPALGFFNVYPFVFSYVADHFQYLAMLPLLVLAAAGFARLAGRWPRPALGALAALAGFGLVSRAWREAHEYRDAEGFYRRIVAENPRAWLGWNNLGAELNDAGRPAEAVASLEEALRWRPDYPEAEYNLGVALTALGRWAEAKVHYEKALRSQPDHAASLYNYGVLLIGERRFAEAAVPLERANRVAPGNPNTLANLGGVWLNLGRADDAIRAYEEALRLEPRDAEFRQNLATALGAAGRAEDARRVLEGGGAK